MFASLPLLAAPWRLVLALFEGGSDNNGRSVKWLDGLRGIASVLVILTHLARAWDYDLFLPQNGEDIPPRWLQLPILRIPWQGRIGVTIFAFLTGYVCALKPLKLARSGNYTAAFSTISKSAFRRPPRLILPATIAMVIAWTVAQLGGFTVGNRADSEWIRFASPVVEDSIFKEIVRLFHVFLSTWTNGHMDYDDHQWALLPLLKGSMIIYVVLCGTMYMQYRFRMLVYTIMFLYFWQHPGPDTETFGQQFFVGMFLSDLANDQSFQSYVSSLTWSRRIFCWTVALVGLFFASFPGERPEFAPWSRFLLSIGRAIFPNNVNLGKRFSALGLDLIILAIYLSPTTKSILSKRLFLFLGRNSFAVYLCHGTLLRVALTWMIYGISGQPWEPTTNEAGEVVNPPWLPRGGPLVFAVAIPVWFCIVYVVAHLWTTHVDSFCARLTHRLEMHVFEQDEKAQHGGLPR
ncbi:transcription initiation factor TFIID subunit 11 [Blastomyces parvus]|uniref:Transcription initiation factor TFIID subunit 11 n=1 Tax=Blastomyces parvus TaxID=2060905 RepID=A0A2B7XCC3_9EURO|nr:transcription initiation factor TFIID subunit 11 [Blastomyces parvus]